VSTRVCVTDAVDVPAAPDVVWDLLVDELRGGGGWWSATNTFAAAGDPATPGTRVAWQVRPNGTGAPGPVLAFGSVTTRASRGTHLAVRFDEGVFAGDGRFVLTPGHRGTRLAFEFDATTRGWVSGLAAVVDVAAKHSAGVRAAFHELAGRVAPPAVPERSARWVAGPAGPVLAGRHAATRTGAWHPTPYGDDVYSELWEPPGGGTGDPVLLVHGWGSSRGAWADTVEGLLERGTAAVVLDLPGHGSSRLGRSGRVTLERVAAAVAAVARHRTTRPVVVAHSGGGLAAVLAVASEHVDVAGLVLLATAARDAGASPPELAVQGSGLLTRALRSPRLAEAVLSRTMGPSQPYPARPLTAARLAATPPAVRRAYFAASRSVDLVGFLGHVDVPAVVLVGDEDRVVPADAVRATADALPQGRFRLVPGVGHAVPEESPGEVLAAVGSLLDG